MYIPILLMMVVVVVIALFRRQRCHRPQHLPSHLCFHSTMNSAALANTYYYFDSSVQHVILSPVLCPAAAVAAGCGSLFQPQRWHRRQDVPSHLRVGAATGAHGPTASRRRAVRQESGGFRRLGPEQAQPSHAGLLHAHRERFFRLLPHRGRREAFCVDLRIFLCRPP